MSWIPQVLCSSTAPSSSCSYLFWTWQRNVGVMYNLLVEEGRHVAAALLPNDPLKRWNEKFAKSMIHVARGWTWKCETRETRIKCLRKNPKHLTLTHTLPQSRCKSSGPLILKNITCVLSLNYFVLLRVLMYLIASVVLRLYKRLDTLGVMYKSSMERSLSFWDFGFKF